jgi:hypothetical protein
MLHRMLGLADSRHGGVSSERRYHVISVRCARIIRCAAIPHDCFFNFGFQDALELRACNGLVVDAEHVNTSLSRSGMHFYVT